MDNRDFTQLVQLELATEPAVAGVPPEAQAKVNSDILRVVSGDTRGVSREVRAAAVEIIKRVRDRHGLNVDSTGAEIDMKSTAIKAMKDIPENAYKDKFNTDLGSRERDYQAFVENTRKATGRDMANEDATYDMRGWWDRNGQPTVLDRSGHFPDTWKKPSHPTFSTDSQYSNADHPGGKWEQLPDGQWSFMPSEKMLETTHSVRMLESYFARAEPSALLVIPERSLKPR